VTCERYDICSTAVIGNKGLNFTIYCMSLLHASTASRQLGNAPAVLARAGVEGGEGGWTNWPIGDKSKKA
jgi:hypothetical protein